MNIAIGHAETRKERVGWGIEVSPHEFTKHKGQRVTMAHDYRGSCPATL